jgi:hypothetical protein
MDTNATAELSEKQLQEIEQMANAFFSENDVCDLVEIDYEYRKNPEFIRAYKKGKLTKEYELRKAVLDLAVNGSSPAQIESLKMLDKINLENV